jgi:hypothetical protein
MHGQGSILKVSDIVGPIKPNRKERIIAVIESRILTEHGKYAKKMPEEWAKIAAHKIFAEISEM